MVFTSPNFLPLRPRGTTILKTKAESQPQGVAGGSLCDSHASGFSLTLGFYWMVLRSFHERPLVTCKCCCGSEGANLQGQHRKIPRDSPSPGDTRGFEPMPSGVINRCPPLCWTIKGSGRRREKSSVRPNLAPYCFLLIYFAFCPSVPRDGCLAAC